MFFPINNQINNQAEIHQNLNKLLNNLSAREKHHSASFIIAIIKEKHFKSSKLI